MSDMKVDMKVLVMPNGARYELQEGSLNQDAKNGDVQEYKLKTPLQLAEGKEEFSYAAEVVDFSSLDHRESLLGWLLTHNDEFVQKLTKKEGFRGDRMDISIVVNGVTLISDEFDRMMDHLTTVLFDQKLSNEVAAGSDGAMLIQKRRELEAKLKAFEDLTHEVEQQMWQTREYAGRLLSRQYD